MCILVVGRVKSQQVLLHFSARHNGKCAAAGVNTAAGGEPLSWSGGSPPPSHSSLTVLESNYQNSPFLQASLRFMWPFGVLHLFSSKSHAAHRYISGFAKMCGGSPLVYWEARVWLVAQYRWRTSSHSFALYPCPGRGACTSKVR